MSAPFDDPEASRKLPADVPAFVAEVEAKTKSAMSWQEAEDVVYKDVPVLCAIVREQAARDDYMTTATANLLVKAAELVDSSKLLQAENATLRERLAKLETALTHALNDLESAIDVIDAEGIEEDAIDESRVWLALTRRELLSESAKDVPT